MYDYRPSVVKRDMEDLSDNFSLEDDEKCTSQHYGGNSAYATALKALPVSGKILDAGSGLGGFGRYAAIKSDGKLTIDCEELSEDFHNLAQVLTKRKGGLAETNCTFTCADLLRSNYDETKYDGVVSFLTVLHIHDKHRLFKSLAARMNSGGVLYIEDLIAGHNLSNADTQDLNDMKHLVAFSFPLLTVADYAHILDQNGFNILSIIDKSDPWTGFVDTRAKTYEDNFSTHVIRYGDNAANSYLQFYKCVQKLFQKKLIGGVEVIAIRK